MTRRKVFDPAGVTAAFWRRPDVLVALTRRDVGRLFDLYLQAFPDCTQTQLAILTQHDRSDISNWVRGVRQPRVSDIEVLIRIADGLEMPDEARLALGLAPVGASLGPQSEPTAASATDLPGGGSRPADTRPDDKVEIAVPPFLAVVDRPDELRPVLEGFRNHIVSELCRLPDTVVTTPEAASRPDELPASGRSRYDFHGMAVRVDPRHVSLSLRLTSLPEHGQDATVAWARSLLLDSEHLVEAYATIPAQIADALGSTLERPPDGSRARVGPDADSYENFLRAAHLIETNRLPDLLTALALLRHVVETTPAFADGHALYGYALWRAYFSGWAFAEVDSLSEALGQARRALALDPQSTWGRMTLVRVYWDLGRHEEAITEGVTAVRDAPGSGGARLALARALNNAGMAELALPLTEEILALEPHNLTAQKLRVWNLLMAGRVDDAVEAGLAHSHSHPADSNTAWATTMALALSGDAGRAQEVAEQSLSSDQSSSPLWLLLGYVQHHDGALDAAQRTWERGAAMVQQMVGTDSRNLRAKSLVGNMLACVGRDEAAREIATAIEAEEPLNSYLLYRVAHIRAALGEPGAATALLQRSVRSGFLSVQMLRCEETVCALGSLREDPGYLDLVDMLTWRVTRLSDNYTPVLRTLMAR